MTSCFTISAVNQPGHESLCKPDRVHLRFVIVFTEKTHRLLYVFSMLTKNQIMRLMESRPELVAEKLLTCQQRLTILLQLLNEMNEEMLQIRLKESQEIDRV